MCMLSYFQYQDRLVSCELCNVTFLCIVIVTRGIKLLLLLLWKNPPPLKLACIRPKLSVRELFKCVRQTIVSISFITIVHVYSLYSFRSD